MNTGKNFLNKKYGTKSYTWLSVAKVSEGLCVLYFLSRNVCFFYLKMHQDAFGGQAPAGETHSAPRVGLMGRDKQGREADGIREGVKGMRGRKGGKMKPHCEILRALLGTLIPTSSIICLCSPQMGLRPDDCGQGRLRINPDQF